MLKVIFKGTVQKDDCFRFCFQFNHLELHLYNSFQLSSFIKNLE